MPDDPHELLRQIATARDNTYRSIGRMGNDILTPVMNPAFTGGPRWPSLRQGWRAIRREGNTLVASDGLSDPFDSHEAPSIGFGIEFIAETDEPMTDDIAEMWGTWLFQLVAIVSQIAAGNGHFLELIGRFGAISTEIPMAGDNVQALLNEEGRAGVLINAPARTLPSIITTPFGDVQLIPVKLLMPQELAYITEHGGAGRAEVVRRFAESSGGHLSRLSREPVV
ncbi:hypothetical protein [Corallococcus aberystwythensis]|uniref:Suppressor of fused domain protein n=1 Tax=Corallococcus aberystwythensis TaxID=2316722 RepID=A0A3A8PY99_9BACT|nr:hypothetical protein [Corallococcus aberystwythensis]RKH61439.1 hypothetical protein D7W81_23965 [Corallococcus aberystwythensis]